MSNAIQVTNLYKSYGSHKVLQGLSFEVQQGEIFALLGVNGAGKTTALECMEGLRQWDSGSVSIAGKTGVQLQSASLPGHIKVREAVKLFSCFQHVEPNAAMLEALGIPVLYPKQYEALSTGQKRRLHLALALLGDPDVLFLDEPTTGLDVEGRQALHQQIRRLNQQGKTILLASHDMAEVESLCHRIAILRQGRVGFCGTVNQLTQRMGKRYTITFQTSQGRRECTALELGDCLLQQLEEFRRQGISVEDLQIRRGSLEEHFLQFTEEETA